MGGITGVHACVLSVSDILTEGKGRGMERERWSSESERERERLS